MYHLSNIISTRKCVLSDLSYKTACTLLDIASAQRMQAINLIKIGNVSTQQNYIPIEVTDLTKTSRAYQPLIRLHNIHETPNIFQHVLCKRK